MFNSSHVADGNVYNVKDVASTMWLVFPPIYILIGTVSNILAILILVRRQLYEITSTVYLISLAVCDLAVLYSSLLSTWISKMIGLNYDTIPTVFCKLIHWLDYSTRDCSVWILVVITVDRIVASSTPFKYRRTCTHKRARITVAVLVMAAHAINFHILLGFDVREYAINNVTVMKMCTFSSDEYAAFFKEIFVTVDFFKFFLIPFITISVGSGVIVYYIYKNTMSRSRRIGPLANLRASSASRTSTSTALVALNVVFIVCTAPLGFFVLAVTMNDPDSLVEKMKGPTWAVICMLLYLNNVLNFFTFILTGSRFREEFKKMIYRRLFGESTEIITTNNGTR